MKLTTRLTTNNAKQGKFTRYGFTNGSSCANTSVRTGDRNLVGANPNQKPYADGQRIDRANEKGEITTVQRAMCQFGDRICDRLCLFSG